MTRRAELRRPPPSRRDMDADETAASDCGVKFSAARDGWRCSRGTRGCIGEHDAAGLLASPLPLSPPDVAIVYVATSWRATELADPLPSVPELPPRGLFRNVADAVLGGGIVACRAMRRGDDAGWHWIDLGGEGG